MSVDAQAQHMRCNTYLTCAASTFTSLMHCCTRTVRLVSKNDDENDVMQMVRGRGRHMYTLAFRQYVLRQSKDIGQDTKPKLLLKLVLQECDWETLI